MGKYRHSRTARDIEAGWRQSWMQEYEQCVLAARPKLRGQIDWATATYLFQQGEQPRDAAERYIANH